MSETRGEPAMIITIHGVKCDAPGCDYSDPSAVPGEAFVGTPCPKCGATLFTPEDWAALKMTLAIADWINATSEPAPVGAERVTVPIEMDGTGMARWVFPEAEA